MSEIVIGTPYVKVNNDKALLCADIEINNVKECLYFETEIIYEHYLNTDNNDAFILALLNSAMYEGLDLHSSYPVSERLLFQLNNYYIPIITSSMPELKPIKISAPWYTNKMITQNAVATGCSGGVDSFYTMLSYRNVEEKEFQLTHVVFNNISTADNDDDRIRTLFEKDVNEKKIIAEELGLKAISVYTNLYKFYKSQFIYNFFFSAQYICIPYALNKLINTFYYSSGFSIKDFSINRKEIKDSANFDLFALSCFSTDYMKLYSAGSEVERLQKTDFISDNNCVHNHLQVCSEEQYAHFYVRDRNRKLTKLNCGTCGKCMRTIVSLYALGKLDKYEKIFDLRLFKSNIPKYIGHEFAHDTKSFSEPIKKQLKEQGLYSFGMLLWKLYWRIHDWLWFRLRKSKKLRKIYGVLKYGTNERK